MPVKVRFRPDDGDEDTEGQSFKIGHEATEDASGHTVEVEVERMKLETADGQEITLEPEGEGWKVTEGPDDLQGHGRHVRL